ncbi:PadR family transcriptional regulator [Goodfellowiella coeruleoviolacea]|uniref:DNA-binding transcriptional regulator, PadR family n=1 Tax=Goodfellowiella coeruleoviolacea TaxID=334858 RepID=A0AAE3KE23_9PSEU|nr:PadR family transcriptional regulator [Goodfellowiella coeruleoviolacea]MCP2163447.1 DNA-binding transcriptional regulator, PadR family [Goodfellowiella coeruleoviolacea]
MWTDVLLLANLATQPAHGYELRQRVERTSGYALSNNSLYPALHRFFEAGAVTRTAQPQEGRPARHVYAITDVGRELLHDLLAELPDELAADEAEFLARVAHFDRLTPAERLGVLDARDRALSARRTRLHGLARTAPAEGWARVVLDHVLRRTHAEQHWVSALRARATPPPREEQSR